MVQGRQMRLHMLVYILSTTLLGCGHSIAQDTSPPLGLWVWQAEPTNSSFELILERTEDGVWTARVNSEQVRVKRSNKTITFNLPDGVRFKGKISETRSTIEGRFYQSSSSLGYADMVTLVSLQPKTNRSWYANVKLQPRPFRVFLDVFMDEQKQLSAVLRNPERNEIMRATRFSVASEGTDKWELVAKRGGRHIRQSLEREGKALRLHHNWFDDPLLLVRATKVSSKGYYARDIVKFGDSYIPPKNLGDGWVVSSAKEAGFDPDIFDALVSELSLLDPRAKRPDLIHAMLVSYQGKLVFEEYFHGYDGETVHDTRSLGKVFAPVLIGALQQKGSTISADTRPIPDVLSNAGKRLRDKRKRDITLGHLMSFTSGLDCIENNRSKGSEDRMWSQRKVKDFWLYTATLKQLHTPGERYAYCSGSINLVGSSIRSEAGKPIVETFNQLIAKPLNFSEYHWNLAPNGAAYLGGGVYLRPRDILKIGATYAAGGKWNGKQIIDGNWIGESTKAVINISPESTGLSPEEFQNNYFGGKAAYEWRLDEVVTQSKNYKLYEATGNGGQILLVVPKLELAVLFMGGNYRQGGIWGKWRNRFVGGDVIPALHEASVKPVDLASASQW